VDNQKVATETNHYQKIPEIVSFIDMNGNDQMKLEIEANYKKVKNDIIMIIKYEIERIENNPNLSHLKP